MEKQSTIYEKMHCNLVKCLYRAALYTTRYDMKWQDTKLQDSRAIYKETPYYLKIHVVE